MQLGILFLFISTVALRLNEISRHSFPDWGRCTFVELGALPADPNLRGLKIKPLKEGNLIVFLEAGAHTDGIVVYSYFDLSQMSWPSYADNSQRKRGGRPSGEGLEKKMRVDEDVFLKWLPTLNTSLSQWLGSQSASRTDVENWSHESLEERFRAHGNAAMFYRQFLLLSEEHSTALFTPHSLITSINIMSTTPVGTAFIERVFSRMNIVKDIYSTNMELPTLNAYLTVGTNGNYPVFADTSEMAQEWVSGTYSESTGRYAGTKEKGPLFAAKQFQADPTTEKMASFYDDSPDTDNAFRPFADEEARRIVFSK